MNTCGPMDQTTLENGEKAKSMGLASIFGMTAESTMARGLTMTCTAMVFTFTQMVCVMTDSISLIKKKVMEFMSGQMAVSMKDGGTRENSMELEHIPTHRNSQLSMDCGRMANV